MTSQSYRARSPGAAHGTDRNRPPGGPPGTVSEDSASAVETIIRAGSPGRRRTRHGPARRRRPVRAIPAPPPPPVRATGPRRGRPPALPERRPVRRCPLRRPAPRHARAQPCPLRVQEGPCHAAGVEAGTRGGHPLDFQRVQCRCAAHDGAAARRRGGVSGRGVSVRGVPQQAANRGASRVADIATRVRSPRSWRTSASMPSSRSVSRPRSWTSSSTTAPVPSRPGSASSRRSRMPGRHELDPRSGACLTVSTNRVADPAAELAAVQLGEAPGRGARCDAAGLGSPRCAAGGCRRRAAG